jgi:hypothetical protein
MTYDSTEDTNNHIDRVRYLMHVCMVNVDGRAKRHDRSKLVPPEKDIFDAVTPKLKALTYGSDEYKASLSEMGEALNHHYSYNSHHPEHYALTDSGVPNPDELKQGAAISRMSLLDLIEMLCDWKAATERHADGDYGKSLNINRVRFGIDGQLFSVLVETAKELGFIPNEWIPA